MAYEPVVEAPPAADPEVQVPLMDVVGWTLPDLRAALAPSGVGAWQDEGRPDALKCFSAGGAANRVCVESDGWCAGDGRLAIKYARIRGRRMDIATAMVYPTADPARLPILACEWVCIGARCHALVLDVEWAAEPDPVARARLAAALDPVAARWQARFPDRGDAPPWFEEIRSPHGIFSSCAVDEMPDAAAAWQAYGGAVAATLYGPEWLAACAHGPDHPAVTAYKHHHDVASPGRKVMAPRFGAAFTDRFLADWHFGPPGGPQP